MSERQIVLDTETTGLSPRDGDRLVELGCIELINHLPSGRTFHVYLNPERDMPDDAFRIHGLSTEFLRDKPLFASIADDFITFIADDPLIIHNASFDAAFINMELGRVGKPPIAPMRLIDTLMMAKRKFPGASASLDALCLRFGISNAHRTKHGALLDSELLAEVYIELIGGRQASLTLDSAAVATRHEPTLTARSLRERPVPLPDPLSEEVLQAHERFVAEMGEKALWRRYNG